jgi:hypothetical protein
MDNDYRDSFACGDVLGSIEVDVADLCPEAHDAVGDDVLDAGESVRTCPDGVAISYHALEWLYRELKRAKIARAHAGRRIGVRQDELEALDRKILILDYLTEKEIKEL